MAMFDDYPSPDGYVPDNTTEVLPEPPKEPETLPRILYNVEGDFIGYAWEHGDTLTIHHEIDEYIRQKAVGATIKVAILDHNRLEVDSFNIAGNDIINIDIGQELSNKMIDGNYYIDLTVIGDDFTYGCKEIPIIVGGRRMNLSYKTKPQTLITTNQIANGAVTTAKIADGAITTEKLSPDIDIGGGAYDYIIDMTATIPSDGSESSDVVMAQDIQEVCAMLDDHNKTCAVRLHYSVSGDDGWTPCSIIIPMVDAHTEVFDWTVYISRFEIGSGIRDVCIEVAIWYERDEETGKYSLWDDMPQVNFIHSKNQVATSGTFSVTIGIKTLANSGRWERNGNIVYFYVPNTSSAADQSGSVIMTPVNGQPPIPYCYPKNLHFTRAYGNAEYGVFGKFQVSSDGQEARIDDVKGFMQAFNSGTGRTSGDGIYYLQNMTVQFTAMVQQ